jgi:predicted FMN-binding regulatory protein PaiB
LVKGRVGLMDGLEAKVLALKAIMANLQPEGGYEPIQADSPRYQASLKSVAGLALTPEQMTGKVKLGRRLSGKARGEVERALEARGGAADLRTLELMRQGY